MRAEGQAHIDRIQAALSLVRQSLDWEQALRRLDELDARVQDPTLWDDPKQAQAITQEQKRLETAINTVREIESEMADAIEFVEMGEAEGDADVEREGLDSLAGLADRADRDKVQALLSGEADGSDTYLQINAGAGGTESQDWADMLLRMYARWAERRGFKVETVEYAAGDQAGIKSATLLIKGENAYGYAKTESGVHRLVRISPYDSSARRHTSFSSVWVYPVIDDDIDIEINPADLKIDTYRASGAGGQHVNTTDSAVRITHQPTGIVVASQNDRSQHKNRATAMNMLKARLFEREMAEREAAASGEYQEKSDIGWGHQIRSYVLQPYQMVKDLRTGVQSPTPDDVLDGALDPFISAALAQRVTGEKVEVEDTE
ncbi:MULTISPECIES: peptide chain release factor 2 [Erythrobacteraceae]|jgi:peptide chain release factor 2|uniref:Peptide chain release factor 2 n=1 Tax=Qipengyuania citrea TaxID=225971 RepID=A0A6I4UD91_9SPHN|nr:MULTISPECIES: peptide chain release factor 2 [Erythrobacteraceae]MBB11337.1 peptide chain release factor 2 [Sphingomonadaceae bacterium]MBN90320.1 peptide chain release factor 2 [Erythrobacteraceae bacterium]MCZ4265517.1 peptide chain release factor 2 [Erythrobacter sp. G21629-S1]RZP19379.1 MAG: peptide chain release factor 2 [Erythrobacter sp.]KZY92151.1 peptide chain release factor 2 [Erythrobacter sp. HI0074]|tara:strand:+ start:273 stop:1400 length:1128 start_codon:yes stop_codon:yes gene_type:complete